MTSPAAIQGDFVDLRFVKGRKVCQIIIEAPIEAGGAIVQAFGTPNPATSVPVAIARLVAAKSNERKGGRLAQKAGILCNEGAFRTFLFEQHMGRADSAEEAAELIRQECGITSRAELDHNETAGKRFTEIEDGYRAWLAVA